jgi:hypothetical protein
MVSDEDAALLRAARRPSGDDDRVYAPDEETGRGEPGGIARLVETLREHCEAIEYDLLVRGIDLRDLFTGRHVVAPASPSCS